MTKKPARPSIDWEAVEREYRAGQLSVKEIARQHGCTDTGITKRAKKHGWARDLTEKVRQEVKARMAREDARVAAGGLPSLPPPRANHAQTAEAQTVDAAADRGVLVLMEQRTFLGRMSDLAGRQLDELDAITTKRGELVALIEEATLSDKTPQRRNAMMRAVEVPGRIAALKDLSMVAKNLIPLGRQAFGLDDAKAAGETLAELIARSMMPEGRLRAPIVDHVPEPNEVD